MTEYVVDFGNEKSSTFVRLAMAQAESNGARLCEEIVRCRDCKRCMAYAKATYCDLFAHRLPNNELDGFCSWGERREP